MDSNGRRDALLQFAWSRITDVSPLPPYTADPAFLDPRHFISALRPSGSFVVSAPTYEEERDPPTAVDSRDAGRLYKRRRLYITKRSGSQDEVSGDAEEASNEVVKRRALDQLQNMAQSRRVCTMRPSGQP